VYFEKTLAQLKALEVPSVDTAAVDFDAIFRGMEENVEQNLNLIRAIESGASVDQDLKVWSQGFQKQYGSLQKELDSLNQSKMILDVKLAKASLDLVWLLHWTCTDYCRMKLEQQKLPSRKDFLQFRRLTNHFRPSYSNFKAFLMSQNGFVRKLLKPLILQKIVLLVLFFPANRLHFLTLNRICWNN
jgi:hypothetical protein